MPASPRRCAAASATGPATTARQLFCENPDRFSNSVTAVLMPEGHDAEAVRKVALGTFNVSLGGGLGRVSAARCSASATWAT